MRGVLLRPWVKIAGILTILVLIQVPAPVVNAVPTDRVCRKDSPNPDPANRINSAPCGTYGQFISRAADTGEPILIRYMVHRPDNKARAIVVLIAGGLLGTGITGDPVTGVVSTAGQNFLVRSAQLFAEDGYIALTIHRPVKLTPAPVGEFLTDEGDPNSFFQWDNYRISPKHAFDIVRAVARENSGNLPVFLTGTSRGAISVVAQHMLGNGILLSSPVADMTSPFPTVPECPPAMTCTLYVNHPSVFRLQPASVTVPTHVLAHQQDACTGTSPAGSLALHNAFVAAGIDSRFDMVTGGFAAPGESPCEALHFHGFFGVENAAVKQHTKRLDEMLHALQKLFKGNNRPVVAFGEATCAVACAINLAPLASDPGDVLVFSLPHPRSHRAPGGGPENLSLLGSVVTYTPPGPGMTDGFTFVVSDGKGGTTASYVIVTVP